MFMLLLWIADVAMIGSYIALVVAGFRISARWGIILFLLPAGGVIFMIKHWNEGGKIYPLKMAAYVACIAILVSHPDLLELYGRYVPLAGKMAAEINRKDGAASTANARPDQTPRSRAARDIAENTPVPTAAPVPTADPFAVQRAALVKHNTDLSAEFQRLSAERAALKPGNGVALKAFNAKAARYQGGLQALQAEQAQLDALDHPGNVAVQASASPQPGTGGPEAEASAALGRMRASVAEGNYAGFAATLRKCLADYRHTTAFPQIAAYAREVMRDTPPTKLGIALQQQAKAAQAEFDATTRQVQTIVNQTPPTVVPPQGSTEVYWYNFDPGAIKPDFNVADVVTGREAWGGDFVYMKTRPGVFYRSADCEFNPQTKFFFTDRNVPKKKLTDAENREIVRLYRILGKDETIINTLTQRLARVDQTSTELVALNTQLRNAK